MGKIKWNSDTLAKEAKKYKSRSEFENKKPGAYGAARKLKIMNIICKHMNLKRNIWTYENIKKEAMKYKRRVDFERFSLLACVAARRKKIMDDVCQHMEKSNFKKENNPRFHWSKEKLLLEALKYKTRREFQINSPNAYAATVRNGFLDEICKGLKRSQKKPWSNKELQQEALKYRTRREFQEKNCSAYSIALRKKIMDKICNHMKSYSTLSIPEVDLFNLIKQKYPKAQKLRDRKVKIEGKSHIQGLDIDIYIPELRKGIEFDGDYWHSAEGLKKGRPNWPEEDIQNYHQIKDEYFKSKGIELLHINEKDWLNNQKECVNKCVEFLDDRSLE